MSTPEKEPTVSAYPTDKELKRKAYQNEEMPAGLRMEDQYLFLSLRLLYQQNAAGTLDTEKARSEQEKLFEERNRYVKSQAFENKLRDHTAQLWKSMELPASAYAKARKHGNVESVIQAADALFKALYKMDVVPAIRDAAHLPCEAEKKGA